jgi:hypothetical protein
MAGTASRPPALDEGLPSLDPAAVERAYRRERTRRHLRTVRRHDSRSSDARFFVAIAVVLFVTIVIALGALREIHQLFGI